MSYEKSSPFFGIPHVSKGEQVQEVEEAKQVRIIENQLLAAMKGVLCCVFQEGEYSVQNTSGNKFSVVLVAAGGKPPLTGILYGGFVQSKNALVWSDLDRGKLYYLYLVFRPDLYQDPTNFSILASEKHYGGGSGEYLYLATVDYTGKTPILNTYPDGKVYSRNIALHGSDSINPHGTELIQDSLIVNKHIKLDIDAGEVENTEPAIVVDDGRVGFPTIESKQEIRFKDKRTEVTLTNKQNSHLLTRDKSLIGAINELVNFQVLVMDGLTDENGKMFEIPEGEVIKATEVHQVVINGEFKGSGEFGVEYADTSNAFLSNQCKIYASHGGEVLIKIIVYYKMEL